MKVDLKKYKCRAGEVVFYSKDKFDIDTDWAIKPYQSWKLLGEVGFVDDISFWNEVDWSQVGPEFSPLNEHFNWEGDTPCLSEGAFVSLENGDNLRLYMGWPMAQIWDTKKADFRWLKGKEVLQGYPKVTEKELQLPELVLRVFRVKKSRDCEDTCLVPLPDNIETLVVSNWNKVCGCGVMFVFKKEK